jgi:hypothetical protein
MKIEIFFSLKFEFKYVLIMIYVDYLFVFI